MYIESDGYTFATFSATGSGKEALDKKVFLLELFQMPQCVSYHREQNSLLDLFIALYILRLCLREQTVTIYCHAEILGSIFVSGEIFLWPIFIFPSSLDVISSRLYIVSMTPVTQGFRGAGLC